MTRIPALVLGACMIALAVAALADEIELDDGSKLVGTVKQIADEKLVIDTAFAGELEIDMARVVGITTTAPTSVKLATGDVVVGRLRHGADTGQRIDGERIEGAEIEIAEVKTAWRADGEDPDVAALRPVWNFRAALGIDGQTGNSETLNLNGLGEIRRTTPEDRMQIYASIRYSHEDGKDTTQELIGGIKLEHDLSGRWFAFGRGELEHDRFEDIDLRALTVAGLGYFFIEEESTEFKGRLGVGYQSETFISGGNDDGFILEIGEEFRHDFENGLRFVHSLVFYPQLEDVTEDWRARMRNAIEVPLGSDEKWKLQMGIRNEYNNLPPPGVDELDTYYFTLLGLDF